MWNKDEKGQTLLELIVVISVAVIVISALTFATISGLRNAQFSKNQSQSTKLAQEGIEKIRSIRDRNGSVVFTHSGGQTQYFSDLWTIPNPMSNSCAGGICYFRLACDSSGTNCNLTQANLSTFETLSGNLQRQVQITDDSNFASWKTLTVIVVWSDFSGTHQSTLTTRLRQI